jgi:uncharacterized membrane protein YqjE
MESTPGSPGQLAASSRQVLRRFLTISGNRVEILLVELQEERERIVLVILLALGVAAFGLLGGVAVTVAVAILFWSLAPVAALLVLAACHLAIALFLYGRLNRIQHDWRSLSATLDQIKKDCECLEHALE